MTILIDSATQVLVQGITGDQARFDSQWALKYGTRIVAGVTPGRGHEFVHGVPVYDTVLAALQEGPIDASVIYVPPQAAKMAALEAIDAGIELVLVTTEYVPLRDVLYIVAAAKDVGVKLVGCNTNGVISPGQCRLGGIGGVNPNEIFVPGAIGVCSRSGGMTAEIGLALTNAGYGVSTCVAMGGDRVTGMSMVNIAELFEADEMTDALVVFGEPGTQNEHELAEAMLAGRITKPVIGLVVGVFQERYPKGISFGHAAAMITVEAESATAKREALARAGALIANAVEEIPELLGTVLTRTRDAEGIRRNLRNRQ